MIPDSNGFRGTSCSQNNQLFDTGAIRLVQLGVNAVRVKGAVAVGAISQSHRQGMYSLNRRAKDGVALQLSVVIKDSAEYMLESWQNASPGAGAAARVEEELDKKATGALSGYAP